ncbi:hypothetical protein C8R44DRAFT_754482 [Mycena epipterygia]|nr:hypothetical protein C8R44DRAFT_755376 [Mycena epipterygia]KAJ7080053.1 hypothetical protein C8R44DRAFT_754482 [Mycena epipterygia]
MSKLKTRGKKTGENDGNTKKGGKMVRKMVEKWQLPQLIPWGTWVILWDLLVEVPTVPVESEINLRFSAVESQDSYNVGVSNHPLPPSTIFALEIQLSPASAVPPSLALSSSTYALINTASCRPCLRIWPLHHYPQQSHHEECEYFAPSFLNVHNIYVVLEDLLAEPRAASIPVASTPSLFAYSPSILAPIHTRSTSREVVGGGSVVWTVPEDTPIAAFVPVYP